MKNIRHSKELVRSWTPQGGGLENLCPRAYLTLGLIEPPLPESPEYQVCRDTCKLKYFWHFLRSEQGQALLGAVGAHVSLQGGGRSTQHFLLSTGIAAAQPPWCPLAVQQFVHAFSPSCFPGSSFPVLDSFLLCPPLPFSRGNIRNGSGSSWRNINAVGRAELI